MPIQANLVALDQTLASEIPRLEGWCNVEKAKAMARLVVGLEKPSCLELGVFGGRSLIAMGLGVKFAANGGLVEGVDPFTASAALEGTNDAVNQEWWAKLDYAMILRGAQDGIRRLGLSEIVRLVLKRSQDVVGNYADGSIDVLHQDSNHSEEVSCWEVASWTPKMKPGGFWVFDDTNWPSTQLAQGRLMTQHGYTKIEDHTEWAIFRAPSLSSPA